MYKYLSLILLFFLISSCRKNGDGEIYLNSFPLQQGNEWQYDVQIQLIGETSKNSVQSSYYRLFWKVQGDTLINGAKCGRILMRDSSFSRGVTSGLAYYQNRPDGLFSMGYGEGYHGGPFSFFNIEDDPLFLRFRRLRTFTSNSKTKAIPKNPIQLLKFPVNINESWSSNEWGPLDLKRKWKGRESVLTKAGIFDCLKLQIYLDEDSDGVPDSNFATIYQYFSSEGLIKEEHFQDGITFAEGGPARLEVVKELISFKK